MLSVQEIKRLIDDDRTSEKKQQAAVGLRYYEGKHDILNCRMFYFNADGKLVEDTARANIKIVHPFFTELADQLSYYLLSFKENPIRAKEKVEGLQEYLDRYFGARFWSEIGDLITGAYVKGFEYLYAAPEYDIALKKNRLKFQCADSMGVVEVREKDTDDGCKYIIYWYIDRIDKGKKAIKRIQVWSENDITYYVQSGDNGKIELDKAAEINPRPHVVGTDENGQKLGYSLRYIPFWCLDNNKKQFSGLKPIKGLIDDYDLHACSLSNNLKDFDTPLHVVSGFQGDNLDELQQNLKTKKIVGVDSEGGVDVKTVDIPYQARKEKLEIDEKGIYKFGMGFNASQTGDGNITNVVIQSRYSLLDIKADKMQDRVAALLEDSIIPVVLDEINAENGTDYQISDVEIIFERDTVTNETENIQNEKIKAETEQIRVNTILNVAANVGDEQALKAICDVMEWDFEELQSQVEKLNEEQNTAAAKATLEGVVIDEQVSETGSGAVPE
jgi:SPP1 family phage portal protein